MGKGVRAHSRREGTHHTIQVVSASGMAAARRIIEEWRIDYNGHRPHTSLCGLTPNEFATGPDRTTRRTESSYERGLIGGVSSVAGEAGILVYG